MFCTKCGNQLPENSKFCKYCGNPVRRNQSLLERARNQEEDALAEIYNQSSSAVYRVIKVLVKDFTGYICKSIYQTGSASG